MPLPLKTPGKDRAERDTGQTMMEKEKKKKV